VFTTDEDVRRLRVVLLISPKKMLASCLRAVLEPHGYQLRHASDPIGVPHLIESERPDVVILDEELADQFLGLIGRQPGLGGPDLPVLLYSAGSWNTHDRPAASRLDDVVDSVWDVVVEPVRPQDLLTRLERLHELRAIWRATSSSAGHRGPNFEAIVHGLPILDSIASRSDAKLGCVIFGPTRPSGAPAEEAVRDDRLARVPGQIRGSDLHAWIGPSELVVILYGADMDGVGSFVSRIASGEGRELSAGISELEPPVRLRGAGPGESTPRERLRVLEPVASARRALDRAREAGGGVRVGATS
jgi:CheY-like chemotaxis protein